MSPLISPIPTNALVLFRNAICSRGARFDFPDALHGLRNSRRSFSHFLAAAMTIRSMPWPRVSPGGATVGQTGLHGVMAEASLDLSPLTNSQSGHGLRNIRRRDKHWERSVDRGCPLPSLGT